MSEFFYIVLIYIMSEISVPEMSEKDRLKSEIKTNNAEKKKNKVSFTVGPKRSRAIPKITLPMMQQEKPDRTPIEPEIKDSIKNTTLKGLSMTFTDPRKRHVMENKLKKSQFVNKYIDDSVKDYGLDMINKHAKMAMIYSYYWFETYTEGDIIQQPQQPQPQQQPARQSKQDDNIPQMVFEIVPEK